MLCSVDVNGEVPEATVLLAAFGLDEMDRAVLRAGAGRLGRRMRFLDITRDMLHAVDKGGYTDSYPLPVLGRLFLADHVEVPGARLLTLDSDMVVNRSLRPLVDLDLGDEFFAAIHDPPRGHDLNYFNSGLTMFDVDAYRRHNIAARSLQWLAEQDEHPRFPDQDALNTVVGDRWHRLDRTWNYFCYSPLHFEPETWEIGNVAHFAGPKPWDIPGHAGERVYYRHNDELRRRVARAVNGSLCWEAAGFWSRVRLALRGEGAASVAVDRPEPAPLPSSTGPATLPADAAGDGTAPTPQSDTAGRDFVATCYEVFLGRELEDDRVAFDRAGLGAARVVATVIGSEEFRSNVQRPLGAGRPYPPHLFATPPSRRQRHWMAERLPLDETTREALLAVADWRGAHRLVLGDPAFAEATGTERLREPAAA